jgi:hypothetical protein
VVAHKILAVALLSFAPAAFAQSNANGGARGATTATRNDRDDDAYRWIGLLELTGLLGRKRDTHVVRDTHDCGDRR